MRETETENNTELHGVVDSITFRNEENGFTVVDISADGELVTAVGELPAMSPGETVTLVGRWVDNTTYGRQFRISGCVRTMPKTAADILKYLSSGAIKGIGPVTAAKIVETFSDDTFNVLESNPGRLSSIKGISRDKAEEISAAFKKQYALRETMIALERLGMTSSECIRVYKLYGPKSVDIVTENPYLLCGEGIGIGFDRADAIASKIPDKSDPAYRTLAGIIHIVKHNVANGHTCVPKDSVFSPARDMLGIGRDAADIVIDELIVQKQLVCRKIRDRDFLFLPQTYSAELKAAQKIALLLRYPPAGKPALGEEINKIELEENIRYEIKQRLAIETAVSNGVLILTGGPGTGKTTTVNGILKLFERDGLNVALAAPTGRAAKRMSEVTGCEAKTIHRLLEVEWDDSDRPVFRRDESNPIDADAVIVDELSMVDVLLFSSLLAALPLGCRLIMVGDSDQLPAVGPGNVLRDLIECGLLPVVALTEVFRQALESTIISNAHRIVRGEPLVIDARSGDFFFMKRLSPRSSAETVTELCAKRLPKAYGYSPMTDIQVLCPSRKGESGTLSLNKLLQSAINPPSKSKKEITLRARLFREGDKVIQTKNNYNIVWSRGEESGTGIFNGDIGTLVKIDFAAATFTVIFDDRTAVYSSEEAVDLDQAFAMTVHKSQGNEFECVVMPVSGVVSPLAYRNLLYTAVTRAKRLMIIVGDERELADMAANNKKTLRYSALKTMLLEGER